MALFTDFFPSAGDQINSNAGDQINLNDAQRGATVTSVTGNSAVITAGGNIAGSQVGNILAFTRTDDVVFAGVVTAHTTNTAALTVTFADVSGAGSTIGALAATQTGQINLSADGQTVIEGDSVTAGDTFVAGDSTVNQTLEVGGNTTIAGNTTIGGTSLTAQNARTVQLGTSAIAEDQGGSTISIGTGAGFDADDNYTVNVGTGNFADVNIGNSSEGAITTVLGDEINVGSTGNTTEITLNGPVNFPGIETTDATELVGLDANDHLVQVLAGNGLTYTHSSTGASVLSVSSTFGGQTHVYAATGADGQDAAAALAGLVSAFNDTDANAASDLGIDVSAGTRFAHGDLILLTHTDTATDPDTTETEAYIFIGAATTATDDPATGVIATTDFADITHAGDVVETLRAGDNLFVGDALNMGGPTGSSATAPVINLDLSNSANGEVLFDNGGILQGGLITFSDADDATAPFAAVDTTTIGGANLIIDPTMVNINSETINIGDGTDGATTLNSATLDINANGNLTIDSAGQGGAIAITAARSLDLQGSDRVRLMGVGNNADAIDINATGANGGGIQMNTTNGAIALTAGGTDNGDINLTAGDNYQLTTTGTTTVTSGAAYSLTTAAGNVTLASNAADIALSGANSASLTANGANSRAVLSAAGTGTASAVVSSVGTGGVDVTATNGAIDIISGDNNTPGDINITAQPGVLLGAGTGAIDLNGSNIGISSSVAVSITGAAAADNTSIAISGGTGQVTLAGQGITGGTGRYLTIGTNGVIGSAVVSTTGHINAATNSVPYWDGNSFETSPITRDGAPELTYGPGPALQGIDVDGGFVRVQVADDDNDAEDLAPYVGSTITFSSDFSTSETATDALAGQTYTITAVDDQTFIFAQPGGIVDAFVEAGSVTIAASIEVSIGSATNITGNTAITGDFTVTGMGTSLAVDSAEDRVAITGGLLVRGGENDNIEIGSSGTGRLRLTGLGLTYPSAGETSSLAVDEFGNIVTAGGGVSAGFDLVFYSVTNMRIEDAAGEAHTLGGGDLLILPPLGAAAATGATIAFPSSPSAGQSFEISNLSSTGVGSNGQFYSFGAANDIVMGTTLTAPFELNDTTASFKFVYTNATYGWVIIGAN